VNNNRPVNLNLLTISFPIPAIVSILHRISGVLLLIYIPFTLWMLSHSLRSEESFQMLSDLLSHFWMKLLLIVFLANLVFHLIAGVRHLFMDMGWGEELGPARKIAMLVIGVSFICSIIIGVRLW